MYGKWNLTNTVRSLHTHAVCQCTKLIWIQYMLYEDTLLYMNSFMNPFKGPLNCWSCMKRFLTRKKKFHHLGLPHMFSWTYPSPYILSYGVRQLRGYIYSLGYTGIHTYSYTKALIQKYFPWVLVVEFSMVRVDELISAPWNHGNLFLHPTGVSNISLHACNSNAIDVISHQHTD